jgi:uncharacterized protein DUF4184
MPFTLTHPAAILPMARGPLVASALVMGSMAPDLPYYVSLPWIDPSHTLLTRTHHISSLLWLDLLIALVMLLVFHLLLKRPLVALLPQAAAERVWPSADGFVWRRADAAGWIVLSVVIGAATHVVWDRLGELSGDSMAPKVDVAFAMIGLALILSWTWRWWRVTRPRPIPADLILVAWLRTALLGVLVVVPLLIGFVRAVRGIRRIIAEDLAIYLEEHQGVLPPHVMPSPLSRMETAEVGLRFFVTGALAAGCVLLVIYAIGWQVSRLIRSGRGSTGVDPQDRDILGAR